MSIQPILETNIVRDSRAVINTNFQNLNSNKSEKTEIQNSSLVYAADTGVANAYVVALTPAITAYAEGLKVVFRAANPNTGASTLNVNGLGVRTIRKLVAQDLAGGEITSGAIVSVVFDGTNFQIEGIVPGTVYTTGDQTIGGVKTFSSIPVLPAVNPTTDNQAVRKRYVDVAVPVGVIFPYGGATAPEGFLLCDGAAVLRTTFSALFDILGTLYGAGNGTTTFNLPNLRSRVPVGLDPTVPIFDGRGKVGGHRLLQAHTHPATWITGTGGGGIAIGGAGISAITGSTGGGDGENMPPFVIVNYIIKF